MQIGINKWIKAPEGNKSKTVSLKIAWCNNSELPENSDGEFIFYGKGEISSKDNSFYLFSKPVSK